MKVERPVFSLMRTLWKLNINHKKRVRLPKCSSYQSGVSLRNHHFRCGTESIAHMLPRMKLSALTQVHTHLFQVVLPELTEEHPGNWNCTVTV